MDEHNVGDPKRMASVRDLSNDQAQELIDDSAESVLPPVHGNDNSNRVLVLQIDVAVKCHERPYVFGSCR